MPAILLSDEVRLRSAIPGRIRWYVSGLFYNADRCYHISEVLSRVAGVRQVEVTSRTGSVLVHYQAPGSAQNLTEALQAALAEPLRQGPKQACAVSSASEGTSPTAQNDRNGLLRALQPHRKTAIKAFGLTLADRLFEASPPALISLTVDSAARGAGSTLARFGQAGQVRTLLSIGAAAWTADSAVGYARSIAVNRLGAEVRSRLQNELYQHFQTLDLAQIESELPEYWQSVFRDDVNKVAKYFEQGLDPFLSIAANALIVFVQMLLASASLAVLQLAVIPALYFVSARLLPAMQKRRALAAAADAAVTGRLRSNVYAFSTIASFAREDAEAAALAQLGSRATNLRAWEWKLTAAYVPLLQMVVGVGFLGTLGLGLVLVQRRRMQAAQLSMIGFSSLRLLTALGYLGVSVDEYLKARYAMRRIEDFRARAPQVVSGPEPLLPATVQGRFDVRNVTFAYPNESPVFHALTLDFPAGKTIGIVGLSGAGKSTLLKLLLRYYDVSSGEILLDGRDIRTLELHSMRRSVAYVPQQPFIFPGTIRENIAYSHPGANLEEVVNAATMARAHDFIQALPLGYDTPVHNASIGGPGQALSGGQAQRIAIARAALTQAPVLLFDEATSAVDNETEAALQESLYEGLRGKTILVVAHRLSSVRAADRVYVLDQGRVAEAGTHEELIATNGLYAGFWRVQTGETEQHDETIPTEPENAPLPESTPLPESAPLPGDAPLPENAADMQRPEDTQPESAEAPPQPTKPRPPKRSASTPKPKKLPPQEGARIDAGIKKAKRKPKS